MSVIGIELTSTITRNQSRSGLKMSGVLCGEHLAGRRMEVDDGVEG